ncbi:hypothetical protein DY000_02040767 [Brassica cretica]|uniref:Uncharacterized protein n=1 Tax=Brassica cretica TaxID=69181 RepID=A0ABQ7B9V5_BRACR|nr:hypothetical protein DY000_02040767 [Brassica cretica]
MDSWSLEADLVTRRMCEDTEVVEEPGCSPWILRSYSRPEGPSLDPRITTGARRRKSLTCFRGCWCGCYDPSARLRFFPRLRSRILIAPCTFHIGTLGENTQVLNSSIPQARHRPLDPRWKKPRFSGSPLEGTPVPRIPARRNPGSLLWSFPGPVPGSLPSSGKWKTSDKENLPYIRIWKSLTYSNRLRSNP